MNAGVAETSEVGGRECPALESRTLLHLPLRELLLHGVLDNRGMILMAAAYGLLWEAGLFQRRVGSRGQRRVRAWPRARHDPADCRGRAVAVAGRIAVLLVGIVGLLRAGSRRSP